MLMLKLASSSSKKSLLLITKNSYELCGAAPNKVLLAKQTGALCSKLVLQSKEKRLLHTTPINRDLEAAFKAIASGIAAVGVIGPGIGLGTIFGQLLNAIARNPSVSNKLFQYGIMGAALCESIAFFALMIAFISIT